MHGSFNIHQCIMFDLSWSDHNYTFTCIGTCTTCFYLHLIQHSLYRLLEFTLYHANKQCTCRSTYDMYVTVYVYAWTCTCNQAIYDYISP